MEDDSYIYIASSIDVIPSVRKAVLSQDTKRKRGQEKKERVSISIRAFIC